MHRTTWEERVLRGLWGLLAATACGVLGVPCAAIHAAESVTPPVIRPEPASVAGIGSPVVSLNGEWEISLDMKQWKPVAVPGEPALQGFGIGYGRSFGYRKRFDIPADFAGAKILLRFHGVYGYVKVFVNDKPVRDHRGGFTIWDCDLTEFVTPGKPAELRMEVTDEKDDISLGSVYAGNCIASILRKVQLIALPACHLKRLYLDTDLTDGCKNGSLLIRTRLDQPGKAAVLRATLTAPDGKTAATGTFGLTDQWLDGTLGVESVRSWDAEHPNLYTLTLVLTEDGTEVAKWTRRVGFRTIKIDGNKMLVNGRPVKLRGINRHDIHPTLGRAVTPEYDRLDAELLKRANVNFVRTAHYPTTVEFLNACDELGIYVEDEAAVVFVKHRHINEHREQYLGQMAEMIESHRNHPSVMIWSLGNESYWGPSITECYNHAKAVDPGRPLIFSFPVTVAPGVRSYDILSDHYPEDGCLDRVRIWDKRTKDCKRSALPKVMPIIHDEWVHVACYCKGLIEFDPNVRHYWGLGMKRMWDDALKSERTLGGAIWCMIDDKVGPWGIVDIWRREKPEFYLTRKAYSPVRVMKTEVDRPENGRPLTLPVANRFDHTSFDELAIRYEAGKVKGTITAPAIAPHTEGVITIPAQDWDGCGGVAISFTDAWKREVDDVRIAFPASSGRADKETRGPVAVKADASAITLKGGNATVKIDAKTGFVNSVAIDGEEMLAAPFQPVIEPPCPKKALPQPCVLLSDWVASSVTHKATDNALLVTTKGTFKNGPGMLTEQSITSNAIDIAYAIEGNDDKRYFGYLGFAVPLTVKIDTIQWKRKALWTTYPKDHIGRPQGIATKRKLHADVVPGENITWPFAEDSHNFYFNQGQGYNAPVDFLATKQDIEHFSATAGKDGAGLAVVKNEDAPTHCQTAVDADGRVTLRALNLVDYSELGRQWGNYVDPGHKCSRPFTGKICLRFVTPQAK